MKRYLISILSTLLCFHQILASPDSAKVLHKNCYRVDHPSHYSSRDYGSSALRGRRAAALAVNNNYGGVVYSKFDLHRHFHDSVRVLLPEGGQARVTWDIFNTKSECAIRNAYQGKEKASFDGIEIRLEPLYKKKGKSFYSIQVMTGDYFFLTRKVKEIALSGWTDLELVMEDREATLLINEKPIYLFHIPDRIFMKIDMVEQGVYCESPKPVTVSWESDPSNHSEFAGFTPLCLGISPHKAGARGHWQVKAVHGIDRFILQYYNYFEDKWENLFEREVVDEGYHESTDLVTFELDQFPGGTYRVIGVDKDNHWVSHPDFYWFTK